MAYDFVTGDLFEIIATTRSMRWLKPPPVPPELIRKILEAGTAAPSGGNMPTFHPHLSSRPTDACGAGSMTGPGGPGGPAPSWHSIPSLGVKLLFKKPVIYPPQR